MASARSFQWGSHDCCLFASDCVRAITGVDPASRFRGRYKTRLGAIRIMRRHAGGGVVETARKVAADLGLAEVPVLRARRGDVVYASLLDAETQRPDGVLGVVDLSGAAIGILSPRGLFRLSLSAGLQAWRIGQEGA